jgi:hypothetical protein
VQNTDGVPGRRITNPFIFRYGVASMVKSIAAVSHHRLDKQ